MGSLSITLLGTSFKINANQDSEYLQQLLDYYSTVIDRIQDKIPYNDSLQTAILAGIMISDELYSLKYSKKETDKMSESSLLQIESLTLKMIQDLEQALQK